ncbi:MAG: CPBP family intramembrane glutamic endopeptidase [Bacillota bacterium]|jgi:membrane protease YdiL (CAAX protease family)
MGQGKIGFGKCVLLTVISQILMIGLACVLMFCFRGQSIGDLLFPRRSWGEICLYGLAVAVAAAVAVGGVYRIFSPLRRSVAPVLHSMKEEFVLPGLLFMGIGSALGEEILFRGVLQPLLGIFVSSFIFGLLHTGGKRALWGYGLAAFGIGMVFAHIYQISGELLIPVIAHGVYNGLIILALFAGCFD